MAKPSDGRSRRRIATREAISSAATRLFYERGFDQVTVDDIAAAAHVGRMTVFNHFPRKEDMFFDLEEEGRATLRDAIEQRAPGVSPIKTLRLLAHRLISAKSPLVAFNAMGQLYIETIEASEALKARARAIRDETAQLLAEVLCKCVGQEPTDVSALLAADLLLATWTVAFLHGHRTFRQTQSTRKAEAAFLSVIESGTLGVRAAVAGTPYA